MTVALYATIWSALALFVTAEAGRRRPLGGSPVVWPRAASILGGALLVSHVLIALSTRYDWDHEAAVRETARQAASVYGFEWRGNIYVSYAFVVLWFFEVVRWRTGPVDPMSWIIRGFFFLIIFNGAVVFATTPWTRAIGVGLVSALVWAWWPDGRDRALTRASTDLL